MKKLFDMFNGFEIGLWGFSVLSVILAFILSDGGDIMTLIASLTGVTALIFLARGYVAGQVLTIVFAAFYGIVSLYFKYYGEMITYLGMTAPIAIISVVSWMRHPYKGSKTVEVNTLSKAQKIALWPLAAAVTAVFYFILKCLGNTNLFFSTISVTTSFIASYLSLFRSCYYAVAYAANDSVLIVLWLLAAMEDISYLPMIICFAAFLLNDLYGFISWKRMQNEQNKA